MRESRRSVTAHDVAALAVAATLLAACGSPTEPQVRSGVATPTPTRTQTATPTPVPPAGDVSGAWVGTFSVDNIEFCVASGIPASATFTQTGSTVTGVLNAPTAPCFALVNRAFSGTLQGNTLTGSDGGFGTVRGTLSGSTLEIGLGFNGNFDTEGQLHLHR